MKNDESEILRFATQKFQYEVAVVELQYEVVAVAISKQKLPTKKQV